MGEYFIIYEDELADYGVTGEQLTGIGFSYVPGLGYEIENYPDANGNTIPDLLEALLGGDVGNTPSGGNVGG